MTRCQNCQLKAFGIAYQIVRERRMMRKNAVKRIEGRIKVNDSVSRANNDCLIRLTKKLVITKKMVGTPMRRRKGTDDR